MIKRAEAEAAKHAEAEKAKQDGSSWDSRPIRFSTPLPRLILLTTLTYPLLDWAHMLTFHHPTCFFLINM
jgi:hypothetical protein